jgi:hypothetical protein
MGEPCGGSNEFPRFRAPPLSHSEALRGSVDARPREIHPWGPLLRVLLAAIVAVLGVGALDPSALGTANAPRPDRFSELRVCSATAFSRALGRCTKDERRAAITSNRVTCSVTLVASQSGVWRSRWVLNGVVEPWSPPLRLTKGVNELWSNKNMRSNQPLPGGNWRCEFAFRSAQAGLAFRSGGPVGKIVDAAVCPESAVASAGSGVKMCGTDYSGKQPLPRSEPVYCSVVFVLAGGKSGQIQFMRADESLAFVWNFDITFPTTYLQSAFTPLDAGDYLCRFSLTDGTTLDRPFRVGEG